MAYDRNDRGYSRDFGLDRDGGRNRDYGRQPQGYNYDDRGFFDRAGDEVRSWFGDDDAERRRRMDERYDERSRYRDQGDSNRSRSDYGSDRYGYQGSDRGDYGRGDYSRPSSERNYGAGGSSDRYQSGRGGFGGGNYGADRDRDENRSYGQGSMSNYGQSSSGRSSYGQSDYGQSDDRSRSSQHDEGYRSWRDRQMADYDRDYEDYRRENQSKFDSEFTSFRTKRQNQRQHMNNVKEHQEVVGSDGQHIGTVDHVQGDQIKLAKNDKDAGGQHHFIPCSWIESVDDKVKVNKTAAEAKQHWTDEARNAGGQMFGRDNNEGDTSTGRSSGRGGDRNLNKSFSGTY